MIGRLAGEFVTAFVRMSWLILVVVPAHVATWVLRSLPPFAVRVSRPPWLTPLIATAGFSYLATNAVRDELLGQFLLWGFLATVSYLGVGLGLLTTAARRGWYQSRIVASLQTRSVDSEAADFGLLAIYPLMFGTRLVWRTMLRAVVFLKRRMPGVRQLVQRAAIRVERRRGGDYLIGIERDQRRDHAVALTESELVRHTLILGATGSGKTTTLAGLLRDGIQRGRSIVLIDLKGDPDLARMLEDEATSVGRPFASFSLTPGERRDIWNPLILGDPTTRRDKLIALSEWTEPYYRTTCERFAQLAFAAYASTNTLPTISDFVSLLDEPWRLAAMAQSLPDPVDQRVLLGYVESIEKDRSQRSALCGFASRIGTLVDPAGPLHYSSTDSTNTIDPAAILSTGGIAVFSLNSARGQATASQLAALALLDTLSAVGERIAIGHESTSIVAIDEFSAIDGDHVLGLLARARSAGVGVMLSTQELADLARVDERFTEQVLGNTATKIVHRQDVPDSAELVARLAGTTQVVKPTYQLDQTGVQGLRGQTMTGMGSARPVEEFLIHPNEIKRLQTGEAIVIRKEPKFRWHRVQVIARHTLATSRTDLQPAVEMPMPAPDVSRPSAEPVARVALVDESPRSEPKPAESPVERAWLDVTYEQKDDAKSAGARWDPKAKRWYAPTGITAELSRWEPRAAIPFEIPGEDRAFGEGLFVDLVPETAWYSNVRAIVTPSDWKRLSRTVRERAGWTCEACGVDASSVGGKSRMDCHERWAFDDSAGVQKLVRLVSLCRPCHEATHMGRANATGKGDEARSHLITVTGMTGPQADEAIRDAFAIWERRSMRRWDLDVSLLDSIGIETKTDAEDRRAS